MTLREKMARAMWDRNAELARAEGIDCKPWDEEPGVQPTWLECADACLRAMMEGVTPAMIWAAEQAQSQAYYNKTTTGLQVEEIVWKAMLRAALEEK